jgi:hypothetical protein
VPSLQEEDDVEKTTATAIRLQISTSSAGCTGWLVEFDRPERPVPSMQREYPYYHHPAEHIVAFVLVPKGKAIQDVLDYHYPKTWMNVIVHGEEPYRGNS